MTNVKPLIKEEKRKFPWYYNFRVSKEAKDRFKGEKGAKNGAKENVKQD